MHKTSAMQCDNLFLTLLLFRELYREKEGERFAATDDYIYRKGNEGIYEA